MYKQFFGLTRNPFEISPDPFFLVPTARHNEALANLYYGVRRQKGFVVVTGEVGTGKTLLIRCLMDVLNRDQVAFAYLFNPRLAVSEFLKYILSDYGLATEDPGKSAMLRELNSFLIGRYRMGRSTVLIVDEAQHLRRELLEEIRLLTNLETSQQKLLQIILVGHPELEQKLDSPQLRQLKQRVALRCKLEPLTKEETLSYILRRLELAGAPEGGKALFPESTLDILYRHSRGIPRLVNTLCENALIAAYARHSGTIEPQFVEEVAADFRLGEETPAAVDRNGHREKILIKKLLKVLATEESEEEEMAESLSLEEGVERT